MLRGASASGSAMPHVSQSRLMKQVLPIIRADNNRYRKARQVQARAAADGEEIVTVTSDGVETRNTATAGDMVVRNLTQAAELYIISARSFPRLYEHARELGDGWSLYDPKGEILAIEAGRSLLDQLGVGVEFLIEAPWGSDEQVRLGDKLVAPLPALDKVYRIAASEFEQTYKPVLPD